MWVDSSVLFRVKTLVPFPYPPWAEHHRVIMDTKQTNLSPDQLGNHLGSVYPTVRIKRTVVNRLDNLGECLKRDFRFEASSHGASRALTLPRPQGVELMN